MAHVLIMPRQGNTVESCVIQEWKIKEGESVQADTTAAVVETDKAAFEVPAGADGQVLKILHGDGDDVPVLAPIAVIGAAGEDWRTLLGSVEARTDGAEKPAPVTPSAVQVPAAVSGAPAADGPADSPGANPPVSPRARKLAAREALALDGLAGSGPGGRIIERDVAAALAGRPALTSAAKAAAAGAGIGGGTEIAGTGIGGRISAADLAGKTAKSPGLLPGGEGEITETPVKGIRKLIADRMLGSLAESAQFTLNASAPAARLQELRKRMKARVETSPEGLDLGLAKVTINDLILFAVSRVLPVYPFMNALKTGDTLITYERVHLGVAVDTPRGLMVPVIRNASLLSLRQISSEAKRLAAACQNGSAKAEELSGSTFTVTNLGSFGVSGFTPVLNAPEVGILGVCGIELKPVEGEGENGRRDIRFEPHIGFSLTINHQVVDGAPAAKFLNALCRAVADMDLLLAAG
ncbi:MAG: 2-oxo acid dehydrogenase subunit E2 [Treponema sp.]|jgi:pyruvate dehydrogenase E2 component (dihydrolipoamide acetyltransferase)|nr:2-oxo acid dehydrogenase subunit E2 [Treponema sp.]